MNSLTLVNCHPILFYSKVHANNTGRSGKGILKDWKQSLGLKPGLEKKAKRLYEYAINDA
jgi:hypothetical protein